MDVGLRLSQGARMGYGYGMRLEGNEDGRWVMGVGWAHESSAAINGKVVCVFVSVRVDLLPSVWGD